MCVFSTVFLLRNKKKITVDIIASNGQVNFKLKIEDSFFFCYE